ncbi:MAG: hypothetical protein R3B72_24975 [Polyangiaceae bacterium]
MNPSNDKVPNDKVQGEGNYEAARRHREALADYQKTHDVDAAARAAEEALDEEGETLAEAEKAGKARKKA